MPVIGSSYAQVAGDTVPTYLQALKKPLQLQAPKKIANIGTITSKDNLGNTITSVRMDPGPAIADCFGQKLDMTRGWPLLSPARGTNSPFCFTAVNDEASLRWFLKEMDSVEESVVDLFIDLEGGEGEFGRNGKLNLMQILRATTERILLLDVKALGIHSFYSHYETGQQRSIASLLGNPKIPIVVFDCRSDADSSFARLGIRFRGVIDLQIMEAVTREESRMYLWGLNKCIATLMHKSKIEWSDWRIWDIYKRRGKTCLLRSTRLWRI